MRVPAQSYDALLRALKQGEIAPTYYLYGAEDVLKDDAIRQIIDRVLDPSLRDFNLDQRTASQLDAEEVQTLVQTLPMMADRRVAIVRDVEGWRKNAKGRAALVAYLKRPAPETVLILVQGAAEEDTADKEFAANATAVHLGRLPPERAKKWVVHEAKTLGLELAVEAAAHLVDAMPDTDLGVLRAELAKLAALPEGTVVTRELIGDLIGVRHGETAGDWRDAVMGDQPARAATLLRPVLAQAGVSGVRLLIGLASALVGTQLARAHRDRGTRGRALEDACFKALLKARPFGIGDWKVEAANWSRWSETWSAARLDGALRATLAADIALKSTTLSDEEGILMSMAMALAHSKREEAA